MFSPSFSKPAATISIRLRSTIAAKNMTPVAFPTSFGRLTCIAHPFGKMSLIFELQRIDYDILWILNNTEVVEPIIGELEKHQASRKARGIKPLRIIFYFPVDCTLNPHAIRILALADIPVTYTE